VAYMGNLKHAVGKPAAITATLLERGLIKKEGFLVKDLKSGEGTLATQKNARPAKAGGKGRGSLVKIRGEGKVGAREEKAVETGSRFA